MPRPLIDIQICTIDATKADVVATFKYYVNILILTETTENNIKYVFNFKLLDN